MKTQASFTSSSDAEEITRAKEKLRDLERECRHCHPLSPLACVTSCGIWKLKNEYRRNFERMKAPDFKLGLFNALKNKRRVQMLGIVLKCRCRLERLQNEMRRLGYRHSQETMLREYLAPLINAGLVQDEQGQYCATTFGSRVYEIMGSLDGLECVLPSHSKCYEEQVMRALAQGPKSLAELQTVMRSKSIGRVVHRLQEAGLVEAESEKDCVFFFRTQRDPNMEVLSPTEERVHSSIPEGGISARRLAEKVQISLRRVYKYVRRLKGKKLVFVRIRIRTYVLTEKGVQLAVALERVEALVEEMVDAGERLSQNGGVFDVGVSKAPSVKLREGESTVFPLSTVRFSQRRKSKSC
jgi:predicted transcriptional regulator